MLWTLDLGEVDKADLVARRWLKTSLLSERIFAVVLPGWARRITYRDLREESLGPSSEHLEIVLLHQIYHGWGMRDRSASQHG